MYNIYKLFHDISNLNPNGITGKESIRKGAFFFVPRPKCCESWFQVKLHKFFIIFKFCFFPFFAKTSRRFP